ncbi:MAG: tyrosine-type recombinase/integrase [Planctomycetota bacterium]|nr:tyrosine-type recombinase/integrase [Planctomycetota bacterium]
MANLADLGPGTHSLHRVAIGRFLDYVGRAKASTGKELALGRTTIERWLIHLAKGSSDINGAKHLQVVDRYLDGLAHSGLIGDNPLSEFHRRLGNRSWYLIVQAARKAQPHRALRRLHVPSPTPGPLRSHVQQYLDLRRAVGRIGVEHDRVLNHLDRFLQSRGIRSAKGVNEQVICRWLEGMDSQPSKRRWRIGIAWHLFEHLRARGVVRHNPADAARRDPPLVPDAPFKPYIFTRKQVEQILKAARGLPANHLFPLRSEVCHAIFALQYALGLRLGEARSLCLEDIDLEHRVLFIRQTKFHKSRYVPFGPRLARCLRRYLDARRRKLQPVHPQDPAFFALWRRPVSASTLNSVFRLLLASTGISPADGSSMPRPHDLRHSFAVHRLLRWYRDGADVQSRLMHLSTFLGHIEPSSTQVYLTITTDVLAEANRRFHGSFGKPITAEVMS